MPPPEGVRRDQGREPFTSRPQSLEQGKDDPFFRSDSRTIHLAAEDGHLLAKHQELNVLGPLRPAGKKGQPEELTADEGDETDEHVESLADASAGSWSKGHLTIWLISRRRRHDTLHVCGCRKPIWT
ncbi:MAG: hypothetical protein WBG41_10070 [Acidimicrobiales bacterium]